MKKINIRPLQRTTSTHEGAKAYDYKLTQPLTHLTFTFGAALFADGFYEAGEEQVTRFAEALLTAASIEPKFPWQYGVWMRDPSKGKGNRIQGSLVPALLDSLLGETPFTETYVERCLRYRPDDAIAFLTHFKSIEMREPSAAAKRGVAKALTHFDEYQLLKYAGTKGDVRLCDVILWVKSELTALGAAGALALTVSKYLHAPSRARDPFLHKANKSQDDLVPLPLAAARRRLFALRKDEVGAADFAPLVKEARVTWEQIMSQFGASVARSPDARRALKTLAAWNPPKPYAYHLWRYAFLPRIAVTEAVEQLMKHRGATPKKEKKAKKGKQPTTPEAVSTEARAESTEERLLREFLQKSAAAKGPDSLESIQQHLAHNGFTQPKDIALVYSSFAAEVRAQHQELAAPYERLAQAQSLHERLGPEGPLLRRSVLELRQPSLAIEQRVIQQLKAVHAKIDSMVDCALKREATELYTEGLRGLEGAPGVLTSLVQSCAHSITGLTSARSIVLSMNAQLKASKPVDLTPLIKKIEGLIPEMLALEEKLQQPQPTPLHQKIAERFLRLYQKTRAHYARAHQAIQGDLQRTNNAATQEQNHLAWRAIVSAPGLLPDMAFLRNLRNLRASKFSIEELSASAKQRQFKGVWPYQVQAGAIAEPELEPVFEEILQKQCALLPPGRHLGLADASGSMSIQVGGAKGTVTCMDVALLFTAMMSKESKLGASFSDGTWGGTSYLCIAKREDGEPILSFAKRRDLRAGMGGTQVFGAVIELILWLKNNPGAQPPDCLWFFSDMQFHPAAGGVEALKGDLLPQAQALGLSTGRPPLELALELYRKHFGNVDVVLWNLQAYSGVPVPSDMKNVLLVSGYDANTFDYVKRWRSGEALPIGESAVAQNQEIILDSIRTF